jgi:hypothetical protein
MWALRVLLIFLGSVILALSLPQLGSALNVFVMDQNGGRMPVRTLFSRTIPPYDTHHSLMTKDTKYKILCDFIPVPTTTRNVVAIMSIGDVLIYSFYLNEYIVIISGLYLIFLSLRAIL